MSVNEMFNNVLMASMMLLAVLILIAIIRSIKGPKIADRIIAVNMIGTITIVIIAILTVYLGEDYLADICLIYAMVSFLTVVVLCKIYAGIYLERKGEHDDLKVIADNLQHQHTEEKEEN